MNGARNNMDPGRQELEECPASQSVEDKSRPTTTNFIGDKNLGAGCAFRVRQLAVLAFNQETTQRDHEQDTEKTATHGKQRHLQQFRRHSPHEQSGQCEYHATGQRTRCRARRLRNIRFENCPANAHSGKGPEDGDGHYSNRYGCADGQTGS